MGVHGLTTYLRENQRALSRPLRLSRPTSEPAVPLVVDGWSLIYELYDQSGLPWAFGGEYREFSELVVQVARAWVDVGFKPYFVFDGPYPSLKFSTAISRITQSVVQPSLLFFRTSPASRATPRFMRENAIIPPLCYTVTIQALKTLADSVEVHIADEEGDPYTVELAGRLHGYVTGRDSDFVVLNVEGYAGYIPMDEMVWSTVVEDAQSDLTPSDDGFVVARKPSKKTKVAYRTGQGLIPPPPGTDLTLNCIVYSPLVLATHFRLSVSLLPLLGALVGNDFTAERHPVRRYFFEYDTTPSERITKVATTLASVIPSTNGGTSKKKTKRPITNVVDLIDVTIDALLLRSSSTLTTGERDSIVEKTVEATLQYAIPNRRSDTSSTLWPSPACALHDAEACPLVGFMSRPRSDGPAHEEPPFRAALRDLYVAAYRRGQLNPRIMDAFSTGTAWPKLFLEDPDLECVTRSISRSIRVWMYAILEDAIGFSAREEDPTEDTATTVDELEEEDDDDELVDVVEEDSEEEPEDGDPLAPLRGALQELHTGPPSTASQARSSDAPVRPKSIEEHLRRGSRAAGEVTTVPPLASLLASLNEPFIELDSSLPPLLQRLEADRLSLCLRILGSDTPAIRALIPTELGPVLALRWVVRCLHDRAAASEFNRDREKERWTHHEARAFLASFALTVPPADTDLPFPELTNRNVQLVAQTSTALDAIELLVQTLLLADRVPSPAPMFSGRRFHAGLTSTAQDAPEHVWNACITGIEGCFGVGRGKKSKKDRIAKASPPSKRSPASQRGIFSLLAGMDA